MPSVISLKWSSDPKRDRPIFVTSLEKTSFYFGSAVCESHNRLGSIRNSMPLENQWTLHCQAAIAGMWDTLARCVLPRPEQWLYILPLPSYCLFFFHVILYYNNLRVQSPALQSQSIGWLLIKPKSHQASLEWKRKPRIISPTIYVFFWVIWSLFPIKVMYWCLLLE